MNVAPARSDVTVIRADQLSAGRYVLLDVRLRPGLRKASRAVLRSPQEVLLTDKLDGVARDARIAVYGDSATLAQAVVLHLRRNGYRNAAILAGGFESWRDFGRPLQDVGG